MNLIQRLALVVSLAFLFTSFSSKAQTIVPGQEYMTGNVVIPTNPGGPSSWTGSVYQDSLTCWAWGNPGYCGPDAIVRPGNNINFSFGSSYIYQQQNVSSLLPSSTPGLQVSGYEFQFTAKNGNGWDDGRTDQLTALVRFWDTTGGRGTSNLLYGQSYNLNYKFNWTTFNFKETFTSPLDVSTIGQVQYGFLGRDNNGWAGPYGPEVNSVSFALRYKVDTCTLDPLSSSACPGYTTALLNSLPKTTVQEVAAPVATITPTVAVLAPTTSTTSTPVETVSTPTQSTSTTAAPVASTQTASASSSTPTATNPQPKVGEVTVSGSAAKTTMSTSQVLAIVRSEQTRIGNLETSTAQQAVEQAQAAGDKAQQESVSISAATVSQSQASAQSAVDRLQQDRQTNSSPANIQSQSSSAIAGVQSVNSRQQNIYSLFNQVQTQQTEVIASVPTQSTQSFQKIETFKVQDDPTRLEEMKFNSTNPIFNIVNSPLAAQTEKQESQNTLAVNSKVQNNEIAGNVSLESMAIQPKGFDSYLNVLSDAAFYEPKEIYRNQRTVDNARALRQLSTDRLHQEMVNQQYGK